MPKRKVSSGWIDVNHAKIYYELAGEGEPFVMIHAGVADRRQWDNEFEYYMEHYRVLRYDMRGYGKSEPVEGEFSHMADLKTLLDEFDILQPAILMGCSMGGGIAMDFALTYPTRAKSLIMVGSGPNGLELDVPQPVKFAEAEKAYEAGDLDRTCELEIQIWFDGEGRTPEQVNPAMRKLAYEMNHLALEHEARHLGKRLPNTRFLAARRLDKLNLPVLIIVGAHDTPYILAAADVMVEKIPYAKKVLFENAAHLPNMDQPEEFLRIVDVFLERVLK
jgi:pimeloyl-ACP methyl ester carboxylesterase